MLRKTPLKRKTPLRRGAKRLAKSRKDSVGKLKKKLWALCREITAKRYPPDCYTCDAKNLQGSNKHLGHFISSSVCSAEMRYDLANLRFQCMVCNVWKSGNWPAYEAHLIRDGIDVAELKRRNEQTKGMKADSIWYAAKIEEYTALLSHEMTIPTTTVEPLAA